MQPQRDEYQPRWTHFHPQSTVWVLNPFNHEVAWTVADENNVRSMFTIQPLERAELPGGAIATLGVKAIVNEMIQNSTDDQLSLYNAEVRAKYEKKIILRIKEAPTSVTDSSGGSIDLSIGTGEKSSVQEEEKKEEKPFENVPVNKTQSKPKSPAIDRIAKASLGTKDKVVEE